MKESQGLPEIECIEMLEKIEEAYAKQYGVSPYNISFWDPSNEFITWMSTNLDLPTLDAVISYRFSYQVNEVHEVIRKLGGTPQSHGALLTPSCTSSILCVLNWLRARGKSEIVVACPAYFSLFQACQRFGIKTQKIYMKRDEQAFSLPQRLLVWRTPSVLWLTNPIYGAGVYLSPNDIQFVANLLRAGWTVIADECLAIPTTELIRDLGGHRDFISIYSPHKAICVNGMKFSAVLFNTKHLGFMERWADVWYGGLGYSSSLAIQHFLSPNFDVCLKRFREGISAERKFFDKLCSQNDVVADPEARGHFLSCYFPSISSRWGNSRNFLERLVFATGGSVITGNRSRVDRNLGFSFRVNLARSGPRFRPTLARIIDYVKSCEN